MGGDRQRFEEERGRFLANELLAIAREEERKRIGRELHDRVSHTMAVAHQSLELYAALKGSDLERAEEDRVACGAAGQEAASSAYPRSNTPAKALALIAGY